MFAMANAVKMQHGDVGTLESKLFEVETGFKVTIPYETQAKSVRINGFEEADEASNGCFAVTVSESGTPSTVITFLEGNVAVGDTIRVAYRCRVNGASLATVKTNSTTAKGSLYAHWPVYSSGTDCTESAIKVWLHLYLFSSILQQSREKSRLLMYFLNCLNQDVRIEFVSQAILH